MMGALFSFPDPVNDKAARTVALGVLVLAAATLATGAHWLLIPLAYGFWARLATGPRLSPWGWLAQNVIAPRLGPRRPVPGPPKRFAQGMGAAITTVALVLWLLGAAIPSDIVLALILPAAALESLAGYCLGCRVFALLMRAGLVPEEICRDCADLGGRLADTRERMAAQATASTAARQ
jgi:hypothetical protein